MDKNNVPLRITLIYILMSLLWIIFSESLISGLTKALQIRFDLYTIQKYVFWLITLSTIYYMVKKETNKRIDIENNLLKMVNIIKSSQDAIVGNDLDGIITSWNPGAEKLFGYTSEEAIGSYISLIFPSGKQHLIPIIISKVRLGEVIDNFQFVMVNKFEDEINVSITISPIKNNQDEILGISLIAMDMTRQKEDEMKLHQSYQELTAVYEQLAATEEELRAQFEELQENQEIIRKSEERYKLALEGANDVIWEWNPNTDEFTTSDKWYDLTGHELKGRMNLRTVVKDIIYHEDKIKAFNDIRPHIEDKTSYYQSEFRIITNNGQIKWVSIRGKILKDENGNSHLMAGSMTDITERKQKEEKIKEMAYYDSVTQLPNRVLFTRRLNIELNKTKKNKSKGMVLFLDLDDFKKVNDTMGHDYGDELLKNIGQVLRGCVGECDTVARFGGDEFLILVPEFENNRDAIGRAQKILDNFRSAFQIGDKQIYATASIGIAIYPDDGNTVQTILKNVDTAMYAAKGNGKNTHYFFDKEISDAVLRKTEIEKGLREALKSEELLLHYQPQVDIKTGKIHGLEALIRWDSKELGFVSPAEFIPVAEETGIIKELGEWIIRASCREKRRLKDIGFDLNTISVNVSAIQLQQSDFIDTIKNILEEEGLEPHFLEIEITESILMKRLEDNVKRLNDLRQIGVKTALDDFGTGYSSLRYLRMLPLNTLKIDKSFIDGICFNESDKDITDGIIQLAHKINLDVVIEGVEDKNQVELLKDMGCNLIQGYYFSRPLTIDKVEELLKKGCFQV